LASDNTVYAQLDLDVGPEEVAETARKMGIETELDGIPAEGLGGLRLGVSPLEMSNAYATLASGGIHRNPVAIRKVVFPSDRVDHPEQADPKRVLPQAVAYEVTRVLRDNMTSGTGTAAYTGCYGQAGKTGTVDNYSDAWFMGYQPNLSTGVWVGYPESNAIEMTSVHGITVAGGTFPAQIWKAFHLNAGIPCEDFEPPEEPIEWSQFFGSYTSSEPTYDGYSTSDDAIIEEAPEPAPEGGIGADEGTGGYDPELYAPGVGQEPAPPPAAPSPPSPPPAPPSGGGGEAGGGQPSGGVGGGT
jgi:penicillin-binding protein 1A